MNILYFYNDVRFWVELKTKINNILIKHGFDNDIVKTYCNVDLLLNYIHAENKVKIEACIKDTHHRYRSFRYMFSSYT